MKIKVRDVTVLIKLKIGLLDSDKIYLERFTGIMERKFGNQIEMFSFTDPDGVISSVNENHINVLLASGDCRLSEEKLSDSCMFAYLADSAEINSVNGKNTIFRYQSADGIYRTLLSLYSEKMSNSVSYRSGAGHARVSLFIPECEGAGASTAAAAMAEYSAATGRKTLFLNLRQFRETEELFSAPGDSTFTDVIFALKSRKANMTLKLESIVKKSKSGVYFFGSCRSPLDSEELDRAELGTLIDELDSSCGYDSLVIVSDFFISEKFSVLLDKADDVIIVSGDSRLSEQRLKQKQAAITGLEKRDLAGITDKLRVLFNKSAKAIQLGIPVLGIIPDTGAGGEREIIRRITASGVFGNIFSEEAAAC